MTSDDFDQWVEHLSSLFPRLVDFINKAPAPATLLKAWSEILEPAALDDALVVNLRMLRGTMPTFEGFKEQDLARHVLKLCRELKNSRIRKTDASVQFPPDEKPKAFAGIAKQLFDCAASGGNVAALSKMILPFDPEKAPRYRCLACRDIGLVTCWSPATMRLAATDRLPKGEHGPMRYVCAVACDCQAGDRYDQNPDRRVPRFNTRQWLPAEVNAAGIEQLYDFMRYYKPANHEPAFDQYNQQAAF